MSNYKTPRTTDESASSRAKVLKNSDDNNNVYNNDVQMNNNDSPPSPIVNKRRRFNRNFRVFVIYKNNTELTKEFLINQLKIKTESIIDIVGIKSFNAVVVYCKNAKVMETLVEEKGCKLLTFNVVTDTGFWSIGTDKQFSLDPSIKEIKLEQIDMSKTTIKLRVPIDVADTQLIEEVKNNGILTLQLMEEKCYSLLLNG
ncbi:hypothetical protein ABK040_011360 [Willaertia magna]